MVIGWKLRTGHRKLAAQPRNPSIPRLLLPLASSLLTSASALASTLTLAYACGITSSATCRVMCGIVAVDCPRFSSNRCLMANARLCLSKYLPLFVGKYRPKYRSLRSQLRLQLRRRLNPALNLNLDLNLNPSLHHAMLATLLQKMNPSSFASLFESMFESKLRPLWASTCLELLR